MQYCTCMWLCVDSDWGCITISSQTNGNMYSEPLKSKIKCWQFHEKFAFVDLDWCCCRSEYFKMKDLSLAYTATVQPSAKAAAVDCKRLKFMHGQIFAHRAISKFWDLAHQFQSSTVSLQLSICPDYPCSYKEWISRLKLSFIVINSDIYKTCSLKDIIISLTISSIFIFVNCVIYEN